MLLSRNVGLNRLTACTGGDAPTRWRWYYSEGVADLELAFPNRRIPIIIMVFEESRGSRKTVSSRYSYDEVRMIVVDPFVLQAVIDCDPKRVLS